ncbi:MAG TPA: hypothetical protein VER96_07015 [Polyangiaceae bacterium]|nr:hypothetical protein [Polyangiaceae bacterium]
MSRVALCRGSVLLLIAFVASSCVRSAPLTSALTPVSTTASAAATPTAVVAAQPPTAPEGSNAPTEAPSSESTSEPPVEDRASAWLAHAQQFRSPEQCCSQIFQSNDYETIAAIELLYAALRSLSRDPKAWPLIDPPEPLRFNIDNDVIVVSANNRSVSIKVDEQEVAFAGRSFQHSATVSLFRTLHSLVAELAVDFGPAGVLGTQHATRAYGRDTRLGFSFGALVVELESAQNGKADPERLYVLDLTRTGDSSLWRRSSRPDVASQPRP